MSRPAGLKALIAHRNVLIALTRYLMQDRTGGVLGAAIEMLVKVLGAKGAMAYRVEGQELVLVTEHGLPRRAKAWLAHLPLDGEPWFVAQKVAQSRKGEVDTDLAAARAGLSIRPALESAEWLALCACPLMVSRDVLGVLVLAAESEALFDKETVVLLETVGGILALALEREKSLQRTRDNKLHEQETSHLATMGLLSATVARDMAAPLSALHGQMEHQETELWRLRELAASDPTGEISVIVEAMHQRLRDMVEGLRQAQGITSRLLAFSHESEPVPVDIGPIIDGVVEMVRGNLAGRAIQIEVHGTHVETVVDGRAEALHMLLVQLILYAAQECEAASSSSPTVSVQLETEGESHAITVESSGRAGQRSSSKIFEAMTKGRSGAAVGLELAKQTVLLHKGHIEVGASKLGGTMIRVVLPASEQALSRDRRHTPVRHPVSGAGAGNKPQLLWIADDIAMASGVGRLIGSHEVFVVGSIAEAETMLAGAVAPEMILCAVSLPDGLGTEFHAMMDLQMASRFVFITGGVMSQEEASYLKSSGCPTLIKPITVDEVRGLLGYSPDSVPPIARTLNPDAGHAGEDHAPDDDDDDDEIFQRVTMPHPMNADGTPFVPEDEPEAPPRSLDRAEIETNEIEASEIDSLELFGDLDDSDLEW